LQQGLSVTIKMAGMDIATALFDIDGTLIDSNDAHAQAWVQALHEHDIAADMPRVRSLIGKGGDKLLCEVANLEEDSPLATRITRRKKQLFAELLPGLQPTRGARALLEFLRARDIMLVVATSADDHELDQLLKQAGVDDLIPRHASKDDANESKPDPDIIEAALQKAGSRPQATLMIGDTPYDIEAASRAGVASIALRCGGHWSDNDLRGAIALADDPEHLLGTLRSSWPLVPGPSEDGPGRKRRTEKRRTKNEEQKT
jgi:HAD superfamily hydrolase (TIGR01509 family)